MDHWICLNNWYTAGFEPTAFQANHYILIIGAELFLND